MEKYLHPSSPRIETQGIVYFARMCDKIRLHAQGKLCPSYHANLGKAMDEWTCDFLKVKYNDIAAEIKGGLDDKKALEWCLNQGHCPNQQETLVFNKMMGRCGAVGEHLADRLIFRKEEAGWAERDDIKTFFDFIDADEKRL
ncbi:MAG: DUF5069 domain-containing protein [Akkermansiaceae bacterium]